MVGAERRAVLDALHSPRFCDTSPAETFATLLDEGTYLASERTMYRLLAAAGETDGAASSATTLYVGASYEKDTTSGQVTRYYGVLGHQVAMAQGVSGGAASVTYLYQDHLGSTVATTGASASTTSYWPYGGVRSSSGTLTTDKRFTGQRFDGGTVNLYDYGARSYAQDFGWFIQPDSIVPGAGDPQGLNRYAYTKGNPLRYVDPTGHASEHGVGDKWRDFKIQDNGDLDWGTYEHFSWGDQFVPYGHVASQVTSDDGGTDGAKEFIWNPDDRQEKQIREVMEANGWEQKGATDNEVAAQWGLKGKPHADFVFYDRRANSYIVADSKRTDSEDQIVYGVNKQIQNTVDAVYQNSEGPLPRMTAGVFINNHNYNNLLESRVGLGIKLIKEGDTEVGVLGRWYYGDGRPGIVAVEQMEWHPLEVDWHGGKLPVYAYRYTGYIVIHGHKINMN